MTPTLDQQSIDVRRPMSRNLLRSDGTIDVRDVKAIPEIQERQLESVMTQRCHNIATYAQHRLDDERTCWLLLLLLGDPLSGDDGVVQNKGPSMDVSAYDSRTIVQLFLSFWAGVFSPSFGRPSFGRSLSGTEAEELTF